MPVSGWQLWEGPFACSEELLLLLHPSHHSRTKALHSPRPTGVKENLLSVKLLQGQARTVRELHLRLSHAVVLPKNSREEISTYPSDTPRHCLLLLQPCLKGSFTSLFSYTRDLLRLFSQGRLNASAMTSETSDRAAQHYQGSSSWQHKAQRNSDDAPGSQEQKVLRGDLTQPWLCRVRAATGRPQPRTKLHQQALQKNSPWPLAQTEMAQAAPASSQEVCPALLTCAMQDLPMSCKDTGNCPGLVTFTVHLWMSPKAMQSPGRAQAAQFCGEEGGHS